MGGWGSRGEGAEWWERGSELAGGRESKGGRGVRGACSGPVDGEGGCSASPLCKRRPIFLPWPCPPGKKQTLVVFLFNLWAGSEWAWRHFCIQPLIDVPRVHTLLFCTPKCPATIHRNIVFISRSSRLNDQSLRVSLSTHTPHHPCGVLVHRYVRVCAALVKLHLNIY